VDETSSDVSDFDGDGAHLILGNFIHASRVSTSTSDGFEYCGEERKLVLEPLALGHARSSELP
jgi:hypothetical protein